jgi:hypothetical protein
MLHPLDEYPVHQVAAPLLHPATGDPNVYDRHFMHGYDAESGIIFVVALGVYPNRQVIDAALCVAADGHQRSVFASGRLARDRATSIGPISLEVVEEFQTLRVTVDAPDQGLQADLTFQARTAAIEEPRQVLMDRNRTILDTWRYTQFGRWNGTLRSGDQQVGVDGFHGTRDRSWGVRPLSGATPMAPATEPGGIHWLWAPLQFDDACLHLARSETPAGVPTLEGGVLAGDLGDRPGWDAPDTIEHLVRWSAEIDWAPERRWARQARLHVERGDRQGPMSLVLDPVGRIHMHGAGYLHFERGHGAWHDDLDVHGEELVHTDVGPWDMTGLHVHQVMRVSGDRQGVGVLEQLHLGPHGPWGLDGFIDPPSS